MKGETIGRHLDKEKQGKWIGQRKYKEQELDKDKKGRGLDKDIKGKRIPQRHQSEKDSTKI